MSQPDTQRLVFVTGPSGAGRTTAVHALEDLGYEVIDSRPLSLLPRLLDGPPHGTPLALGIDVRNRDFSTDALIEAIDGAAADPRLDADLLFLDCSESVLLRRYSETRRRHPLTPEEAPGPGIAREIELLAPIRARAHALVDTSEMTPHDLRAEVERWFATGDEAGLSVLVESFSYKRGLPRGADLVFDVRFLRNPHWEAALRPLDGRDDAVRAHVEDDPRYAPFLERITDLALSLLPEYRAEGKSALSIALGCTGGQHRSVTVTEALAKGLAAAGWQVSKRHRELERNEPGGAARDAAGRSA